MGIHKSCLKKVYLYGFPSEMEKMEVFTETKTFFIQYEFMFSQTDQKLIHSSREYFFSIWNFFANLRKFQVLQVRILWLVIMHIN